MILSHGNGASIVASVDEQEHVSHGNENGASFVAKDVEEQRQVSMVIRHPSLLHCSICASLSLVLA